jgi:predicted aspartyl protease
MIRGLIALLIASLLWSPSVADAQIYRWVDENGVPHFAEGIDSVPDRYRSRAVPLGLRNAPAPAPSAEGGTAKSAASGGTTIRFVPGQRIMVDVKINGSTSAQLLFDTGADRTLISPRALQAAGVRLAGPSATGQIVGATGSEQVRFVVVDSLEIGEARVGRMPVGAYNLPTTDVGDGLLGRDFLDQFNVQIDSARGMVTLSPK